MPTPIVIDLSHWNTIPGDLKSTKAVGVVGVIHKASEGASYQDDKVDSREFLTRDAGMLFGLYHFLRSGVNITKQVDNFMSVYKRYDSTNLLVAADYEQGSDGTTPTLDELEGWLIGVEGRTGKKPIIYSGNSLKEKLGGKRHATLNQDMYPLWLAQYTSGTPSLPPGWASYWLWQYTDKGSIPGVKSPVDLNAGEVTPVVSFWQDQVPVPPEGKLDFGDAMRHVLDGDKMRRSGWNGAGMWIGLATVVVDNNPKAVYICMYTAQKTMVPWLASVTDMVAFDWEEAT